MAGFDIASFLSPKVFQAKTRERELDLLEDNKRKAQVGAMLAESLERMAPDDPRQQEVIGALDKLGWQGLSSDVNINEQDPNALGPFKRRGSLLTPKPSKQNPQRFAGTLPTKDGVREVIGFSRGTDVFVRDGDQLLKNPKGLKILKTGRSPTDLEFTKKTKSTIEDKLLSGDLAQDRLRSIRDDFQKKFTEVGTRLSVKLTAAGEKFGIKPTKQKKTELVEFTRFARKTLENTNQHIRDRTGAVMNQTEIPRLMGEMPNMGTGLFDGDSATQFQSKLFGVLETLQAAEERLLFAQANGLGSDPEQFTRDLPLSDFKKLPPKPQQFNEAKWNAMTPRDRRRLIELLNKRKR